MKNNVRFAAVAALALFAALPARAQDSHKPGGLNKVAHDVSNTMKKAGRDSKAEVKRDASKTHGALQTAGNQTKTVLKRTTGIHGSHNAHPGGLNKVAHDISNASKHAASHVKSAKNRVKAKGHEEATEAGKAIKEAPKKP